MKAVLRKIGHKRFKEAGMMFYDSLMGVRLKKRIKTGRNKKNMTEECFFRYIFLGKYMRHFIKLLAKDIKLNACYICTVFYLVSL
jgi:hypothetical protein